MKKLILMLCVLMSLMCNTSYCLSSNFKEILSVMGIEKYNNQGYEINEYIYYTYNQIVYGGPEDAINEPTQRWKATTDGKWIRNGEKGEYRLLGYNNIGKVVNNHDFPMDIVPSSEPTQWNYATLKDAQESWNDISRFKFVEQRDYMQNINLMRNDISYDITASQIGLDKARLDNCSTWKTKGLIYTNRIDTYGKKWEATFVAPPIGNDIKFTNSVSTTSKNYTLTKYIYSTQIEVQYSAKVTGDLEYIKPEHVKKLESSIYINGFLLGTITSKNTLSHSGKKKFTIYHEDLIAGKSTATIDIRSKLYTEFTTDGPMYAKNSYPVKIIVERYQASDFVDREVLNEKEYQNPTYTIPEENVDVQENVGNNSVDVEVVKIVKKGNEYWAQEIDKSTSTENIAALGFTNAGRYIGIKVKGNNNIFAVDMRIKGDESIKTLDNLTKQFEWDEPNNLGEDTLFDTFNEYTSLYDGDITLEQTQEGIFETKYLIPYGTKQTLHSWNSLRDMGYGSFDISKGLILSRKEPSYILEFDIYSQVEEETEYGTNIYTQKDTVQEYLDIFECWTSLYNRDISPYVTNSNKEEEKYEQWKLH